MRCGWEGGELFKRNVAAAAGTAQPVQANKKYHILIHRWPVLYPPGSPSAGLAALETREDTFVGQVESRDTKRVVSKP